MSKLKCLQECVSFLENKKDEIEQQIERQEQHSRRNGLPKHGTEERRHEVIQTIKSEMDIDINVKDIDRTHWIGTKTENK